MASAEIQSKSDPLMSNRKDIEQRAIRAAHEALSGQHYVSPIDVLVGIGSLHTLHLQDWKSGRIPYLEKVIQGNLNKINHALTCFRRWAHDRGLKPSETVYRRKTKHARMNLQFSKSGHPYLETMYRTHYISSYLRQQKQERLAEKPQQTLDLYEEILS